MKTDYLVPFGINCTVFCGQDNIIQGMQSSAEILLYLEEGHFIIRTSNKKELEKNLHVVAVFDIMIN